MDIEPGMLVKTLSGNVVKTDNQIEPGYWLCDDERIHLGISLREVNDEERKLYSISHGNTEPTGE